MKSVTALVAIALIVGWASAAAQPRTQAPPAPPEARAAQSARAVDPNAVDALRRMGAYLQTLQSFEVRSTGSVDEVLDTGQKLQFAQTTTYQVRRPNAFHIAHASDRKVRDYYYDGRSLTVFAPRMKYYAQVDAPPTIREVLDLASERYDIDLPLEDLFIWGTPEARFDELDSGMHVGYARIGDSDCDHYAFRQGDVDWQVWIERGARPLPRKLVITTRSEQSEPQFSAQLDWTLNPRLAADAFAFRAPADAQRIPIVADTGG